MLSQRNRTSAKEQPSQKDRSEQERNIFTPASISLPKGGGAIRGIGEKFAANPVTGTGSITVIFIENEFTDAVLESGAYRAPLPCESRTYEHLKVRPSANIQGITNLLRFDELSSHIASASNQATTLPYQKWDADEESLPGPRRRMIEHLRTLYRKNDLSGPLPLADLESLALPYETYKLAFTPDLASTGQYRDG
jgi:hypothetical protein